LSTSRSSVSIDRSTCPDPLARGFFEHSPNRVLSSRGERVLKKKKQDLSTPALLVDLDAMEHNLASMAKICGRLNVNVRPHFKNHTVLALAQKQMQAGAIGITVAHVRHAESLVACGVKSILVANEVVDESHLRQLLQLSREADIIVSVDDARVIAEMGRLSRTAKAPLSVVIDLDLGLKRCGVSVEESLDLACTALREGLLVRGLMGYEGHLQKLPESAESDERRLTATKMLARARRLLEQNDIPVEIVTTAGTGTFQLAAQVPEITEVQPGTYLLMETLYAPYARDFRLALTVLATVISKREGTYCVLDAGVKALSGERGLPSVKDIPGLNLTALHAEHSIAQITGPKSPVNIGDRIEVWVAYSDATVHLHRQMYGMRSGLVEEVFEIEY
jgi:D-serine deaminase-like pyridoxal phosphate-dependent protein